MAMKIQQKNGKLKYGVRVTHNGQSYSLSMKTNKHCKNNFHEFGLMNNMPRLADAKNTPC